MDLDAIFKAYDIRGIYPDQLDEEAAHAIGRALVVFSGAQRIGVGRDMRDSSGPLSTAFISGRTSKPGLAMTARSSPSILNSCIDSRHSNRGTSTPAPVRP